MAKQEEPDSENILSFFQYLKNRIQTINDSKLFAGLMIITLNISSKFVNIKLSKTMESYLRNSFSRQILVFAIAWMGTRDFWIALFISFVFTFCMDYLLNEESIFCILPEHFTDYHLSLLNQDSKCKEFTKEDVDTALRVLNKAKEILDKSKDMPSVKDEPVNHLDSKVYLNQTNYSH